MHGNHHQLLSLDQAYQGYGCKQGVTVKLVEVFGPNSKKKHPFQKKRKKSCHFAHQQNHISHY